MQHPFFFYFAIVFVLLSASVIGQTQPATALEVEGNVQKSLQLSLADLNSMKKNQVKAKDHDGKEHVYSGVSLADILRQAGAALGGQLRGKNLAQYLLVQAKDGYQAVFALPEVDPEFSSRVILLATTKDGQPLSDEEGPLRIVVPGEKKQARWVRQVTSLKVVPVP